MNHADRVQEGIDKIKALTEQYIKSFEEQFKGAPFGRHPITDEQQATWFEQQTVDGGRPPIELFKLKDGSIIAGNAWVLALHSKRVKGNGMAEVKRYTETRGNGVS